MFEVSAFLHRKCAQPCVISEQPILCGPQYFAAACGRIVGCTGSYTMNKLLRVVAYATCLTSMGRSQSGSPVVKKDSVSVHVVERGSMPIFAPAHGSMVSVQPPKAVLTFDRSERRCETGRDAKLVVATTPRPISGKVTGRTQAGLCEVEFTDALPAGAAIGDGVDALVLTDELKDVIYFGRPKSSQPNSTATIFVLEGDSQARRVAVRYGVMSGPIIQVLDGLKPGDRVIVTDMSRWADQERVRLE